MKQLCCCAVHYITSKQSRGILPTKTSQPRAGGGLSAGQCGGGPYLRCPFSCTIGHLLHLSRPGTASAGSFFVAAEDAGDAGDPISSVAIVAASRMEARLRATEHARTRTQVRGEAPQPRRLHLGGMFTYLTHDHCTGRVTHWCIVLVPVT